MKKGIFLPALALAGGAGGFFLRWWQLASAYRPEEQLFIHGAPATMALLGLLVLLAAVFLLLIRDAGGGAEDFLPAFGNPCPVQMTVFAAAGLLLLGAAALGLWDGLTALQQWRADPEQYQLTALGAGLLAALLCLPAGNALLMLGRMAYRGELSDLACRLAPFPAFAGLMLLFSLHMRYGTEPVLMKYGFELFAALLLTLAHYGTAGFLFGRPRPRFTAFCALTGAALGLISLADLPFSGDFTAGGLFAAAAVLALTLSALALAHALLSGPWPGRMPPNGEGDQE